MRRYITCRFFKKSASNDTTRQANDEIHAFFKCQEVVKSFLKKLMIVEQKVAKYLNYRRNFFSPFKNLIFEILKVYKQILQTSSWSKLKLLHEELATQSEHPAKFSDHKLRCLFDQRFF